MLVRLDPLGRHGLLSGVHAGHVDALAVQYGYHTAGDTHPDRHTGLAITVGAIGTSVSTTTWEHRAARHHPQLSEHLNESNQVLPQTLSQLGARGLSDTQSLSLIDRLVSQRAFTMSVNDIFLATAVLFILMIPLVWLSGRILRSDDKGSSNNKLSFSGVQALVQQGVRRANSTLFNCRTTQRGEMHGRLESSVYCWTSPKDGAGGGAAASAAH